MKYQLKVLRYNSTIKMENIGAIRFVIVTAIVLALSSICTHVATADDQTIFEAVRSGDQQKVKALLATNPKLVNERDETGSTPLHALTYRTVTFGKTLDSPLVPQNEKETSQTLIAEILLSSGADINAKDNFGQTPLLVSIGRDQPSLASFLIEKGADVNLAIDKPGKNQGITPVHSAVGLGHIDILKLLLTKGANPNAQMFDGSSPLHIAARYGYAKAVNPLLENGANLDIRDKSGQTPMEAALDAGYQTVVNELNSYKAEHEHAR